jgi:uncharacterized protein with PIN domain
VDERDLIRDFLLMNDGAFCDDCLAGLMSLDRDDVKTAIFTESRDFARAYGYCHACQRPNAVTRRRIAA